MPDSDRVMKASLNLASQGFKLQLRANGFSVQECMHHGPCSFIRSHRRALKDTWTIIVTCSKEMPSKASASKFFVLPSH